MLCDVCLNGLEGMWDPTLTPRLALKSDFKHDVSSVPLKTHESTRSENLQEKLEIEDYIYAHHKTKSSFLSSMRLGCVMCNRFNPNEVQPVNPRIESTGYFSVFSVSGLKEGRPIMHVRYLDSVGGFSLVPVGDSDVDSFLNFRISPSTGDSTTWAMVENWLHECIRTHEHCKSASSQYLPNRLLAINGASFQLVSSDSIPSSERYITLSHHWGEVSTAQDTILLQTTYDHLRTDHAISSLPKTFRDAMAISSKLGIKYLWIDKLCIYQDSLEDWRREVGMMQDIYKNAFLNISALGARDEGEGCFFDRDPRDIAPTIVKLRQTSSSEPKDFRFALEKGWAWRLSFDNEPIVRRGWVVQERLLSPRVLHFGRKQIFWECREKNACEIHPDTVYCYKDSNKDRVNTERRPETPRRPHLWKQLLDAPDRRVITDYTSNGEYEQLFLDWNAIIHTYAKCNLTIPSDKLVALSGLANDMKRTLSSLRPDHMHRYLAGLWEEKLVDQLVWNVLGPAKRVKEYRAPSWSWASVDGSCNLGLGLVEKEHKVDFVEIKEAKTEIFEGLETGEVKGGWVRLVGPWLQLKLLPQNETAHWPHENGRWVELFRNVDTGDELKEEGEALSTGQRLPMAMVLFDDPVDLVDEVFGVQIQAKVWSEGAYSSSALALSKVDGVSGEQWRRVGLLLSYFASRDKATSFFEKFPRKEAMVI